MVKDKVTEWTDRTNFEIELKNKFRANPFDVALVEHIKKYNKILEIGSGQGRFMSLFSNITGLEYSQKFIDIAKKRGVKGKIYKGNAFNMPFKNDTFDMVFSTGLIEHYNDKQALVNEHVRVLKQGGTCIITVPSAGPDGYLVKLLREVVFKGTNKYYPQYLGERMKKEELFQLLKKAGLKNIQVHNIGFPMRGQPMVIIRKFWKSENKLLVLYSFFLHSIGYIATTKTFRIISRDFLVRVFSKRFGHSLIGIAKKDR